ncbi:MULTISPECIES: 2,4-dienoyl-CoA reductase [unclassified Exiguobacterium]|uniref:2,4-dienoyl-CoA reductase n=2 Tax=unclassified Exiguobacterium TaxID=2644629 RepID=UPI001BE8321F|nr:2,4-dienoyl-CoA reductase [Exiguobacterium sp. s55]
MCMKTIWITGGSSGMGKAMALKFKTEGWNVAISGRNEERLQEAMGELEAIGAGAAMAVQHDVRDYEACSQALDQISQRFGPVHALVNNAAGNFVCPTLDLTPNGWTSVIDIVLNGTFNCTHVLGKHWEREQLRDGSIINMVASYAWQAGAGVAPSAAAKAGVLNLTRTLAVEWGYQFGARVNAISPGPIERTGGADKLAVHVKEVERIRRNVPLGRFGTPEEIADLAYWMASDEMRYLNGECISLDGGHWLNKHPF